MAIFKGRTRVRYGYSRWGYTRNNGKGWHGGSDEEGLDSDTILMPDYKGKSFPGGSLRPAKWTSPQTTKHGNGAGMCAWSWTQARRRTR